VRELVTDAFLVFKRNSALGGGARVGRRLWERRFADTVRVQAMDASHVSLVFAEMGAKAFVGAPRMYTADTEISIGLNLNQLAKVLRCADDDDRVVLLSESEYMSGRVYVYVYRPNACVQSFFGDLYDERPFGEMYRDGPPPREWDVLLQPKKLDTDKLPTKEMYFDLPKVFVDEPAIGVPPGMLCDCFQSKACRAGRWACPTRRMLV